MFKNIKSALKSPELVHSLKLEGKEIIIPEEITLLKDLQDLHIKADKIVNHELLFRLPRLRICKFIQTPIERLLLPIGSVKSSIKFLTFKDCGLKALPEEMFIFTELEELNLSGNELNELPYGMTDLKNLKRINIDSNHFEKMPELIKKIPRLHHLSADNNKFSQEEKERIQREFNLTVN